MSDLGRYRMLQQRLRLWCICKKQQQLFLFNLDYSPLIMLRRMWRQWKLLYTAAAMTAVPSLFFYCFRAAAAAATAYSNTAVMRGIRFADASSPCHIRT